MSKEEELTVKMLSSKLSMSIGIFIGSLGHLPSLRYFSYKEESCLSTTFRNGYMYLWSFRMPSIVTTYLYKKQLLTIP